MRGGAVRKSTRGKEPFIERLSTFQGVSFSISFDYRLYLTSSVFQIVLQKSTLLQIRQLIIYYY